MRCPKCRAHLRPGAEGDRSGVTAWVDRCGSCGAEVRSKPGARKPSRSVRRRRRHRPARVISRKPTPVAIERGIDTSRFERPMKRIKDA